MEVGVSDVKVDALFALALEDTVDDKFEEIKICSFGSHFAWIFYAVAANRNTIMIGIFLFGTERAHYLGVCDLFTEIHGNVVRVDYVECVSAFDVLGGF